VKTLLTLLGPNGVGKSTTAEEIINKYANTAYVDSDWCRVMNPFIITEESKKTISQNIYCLLRNYLLCNSVNTVIFTYSWHGNRKEIYQKVIERLKNTRIAFREKILILKCSAEENIKRATKDGRDIERIKRGMDMTYSFYDEFEYPIIDTTNMTPNEVARIVYSFSNED